ncbi:MAG: hypothetical protein ACT4PS_11135 [Betaproteobacteria bacterium]
MLLWASVLWVAGLLTAVPYATYYLFYYAPRDEYALLITFVLFWIFGYWGVAGPLIMVVKVRRVFRRLEAAQNAASLAASLRDKETEDVMIDFIASENRIPRFIAARLYRLLVSRLTRTHGSPSGPAR